ncbi:MAG TPA: universal stress protein [Thermodesulfobacteriota bacterium]|nr:universal stress protein [Thermodesulfobacteriota bacterium]
MKVLVATDGSEHSMKAVQKALEMAQKEGAQVTLMSVAYYSKDDFDDMPPNIQDKLENQAAAALKKAQSVFEAQKIPVEAVLEAGVVPANNILNRAQEGNYDLLLIGSAGLTGIKRALMGSTAAKVVAQAPCSVMVIR